MRRREKVRRYLADAGEELGWDEVAAWSDNPVGTLTTDVKKMLRSGVRLLKRSLEDELKEKKREEKELLKVLATVQELQEDPEAFPTEIVYTHTARKTGAEHKTKTETLELTGPEDAAKAVKKLEKSIPRWAKYRAEAVDELKRRQATVNRLGKELGDVIEGWRSLLKEVVLVLP